jgi:hypothetical protein
MVQSFRNFKYYSIFELDVPLTQISIYPKRIVQRKEHFAKSLTKDAAIEILKIKLRRQHATRKSYYRSLSENWCYMLGEHSSEGRDFGIPRMNKKGMEI